MADPVVHFEIIGRDPDALRSFYGRVFGWVADTDSPVAPEVSDAGAYGFIAAPEGGAGIPGGIGGGPSHAPLVLFYVGVDDVAATLGRVRDAGGAVVLEPVARPDGELVVARFTDPEGNLVGLAGPR
jgi:predicted enzyme related to lactoylglutathione lyase